MNKSMMIGTVVGVTLAVAGGVWAGYEILDEEGLTDKSVATLAQTDVVRERCYEEVVPVPQDRTDPNRIAGTALGAVVGGVVGSQFGDGDGKKLATAAGAAGGAIAGREIQGRVQDNNIPTETRTVCVPVEN